MQCFEYADVIGISDVMIFYTGLSCRCKSEHKTTKTDARYDTKSSGTPERSQLLCDLLSGRRHLGQ